MAVYNVLFEKLLFMRQVKQERAEAAVSLPHAGTG